MVEKRYLFILLTVLPLIIIAPNLLAVNKLDIQNFTHGEHVLAMAEDTDFLYIGTNGGLVKFDKESGDKIFFNIGNSVLPSNTVTAILIADSVKWIGTDRGLVRITNGFWEVMNITDPGKSFTYSKGDKAITALAKDKQGNVWAGRPRWLSKFNGLGWDHYERQYSQEYDFPIFSVTALAVDDSGCVWIGEGRPYDYLNSPGLVQYTGSEWIEHDLKAVGFSSNIVNTLAAAKGNQILVGSGRKIGIYDGTIWALYDSTDWHFPTYRINHIHVDRDNFIWLSTDKGIAVFDGNVWTPLDITQVGANSITCVLKDMQNTLWAGTAWVGLAKFAIGGWQVFSTSNSGIIYNRIQSLALGRDQTMWMGTAAGLCRFDGQTWETFRHENSGLPHNLLFTVAVDSSNNVWAGTYEGGIGMFNGSDWTVYDTSNSIFPKNDVRSIDIDSRGIVWAGIYGGGLAKYDGVSWTIYDTSNSALPNDFVTMVKAQDTDKVWLSSGRGDGYMVEGNWYNKPDYFHNLDFDSNGNLWLVQSYNLKVLGDTVLANHDFRARNIPTYGEKPLAMDGNGFMWMGYPGGFAKVTVTSFVDYKVPGMDVQVNDMLITPDGEIWAGTEGRGLLLIREVPSTGKEFQGKRSLLPKVANIECYPNPFTSSMTFKINSRFKIEDLRLKIYDVNGKMVQDFTSKINNQPSSILNQITWNPEHLPCGIYLVRARIKGRVLKKKISLIK